MITDTPLEMQISPDSALARAKLFAGRIQAADNALVFREVCNAAPPLYTDPLHYYRRMLRAQLDFAEAQVRAGEKAPQPHEAQSGGTDDLPS